MNNGAVFRRSFSILFCVHTCYMSTILWIWMSVPCWCGELMLTTLAISSPAGLGWQLDTPPLGPR